MNAMHRFGAVVAAAAAAATITACSTTAGTATIAGGDMTVGPAVSASTTESVSPTARTWATIPDDILASAPKRTSLIQRLADGAERCTAGPAVAPAASPRTHGFVAAAHCDVTAGAPVTAGGESVAPYTGTRPGPYGVTVTWGASSASPTVAGGRYKVAGVLTEQALRQLPLDGTVSVCMDGATTGLHCGPLRDLDADSIAIEVPSAGGDSGAPLFLVDDRGTATLIGVAEKSSDSYTYAAYLDRALTTLGAKALVDPAAQATVAGDTGYSAETTAATAQ